MSAQVRRTELVQPEPAEALAALLEVPLPDLERDGLPMLWHWLHTLDRPAQSDLGPDGHPFRGGVTAPPGPGQRRMWAGGRVECPHPLVVGRPVTRISEVTATTEKQGRSGPLTFVTVGHRLEQDGRVVVRERQDIVYRAPAPGGEGAGSVGAPVEGAAADGSEATGGWRIEITPTLLFRFSALTYNAHRIHYDRDYATGEEGYPGLVTHGPLQAVAMAEACRATLPEGRRAVAFDYRLVAPLYDHQGLVAHAVPRLGADGDSAGDTTEITTEIRDLTGRTTARGTFAAPLAAGDSA